MCAFFDTKPAVHVNARGLAAHVSARGVVRSWRPLLAIALVASGGFGRPALAQTTENPVYVDDSPAAAAAIAQARARLATNDPTGAARLLQRALIDEGRRLITSPDDPELFISVRRRITGVLLDDAALLARYRELFEPVARALLGKGSAAVVERDYLLTSAGFDAALRLAERRLENAQFDASWRVLTSLGQHPDRVGERAADALRLLERVAGYTTSPEPTRLLARWRAERMTGETPAPQRGAVRVEGPDLNLGRSTFDPGPPISLAELVARPLASEPIPSPVHIERLSRPRVNPRSRSQPTPINYILPTVAGDEVYLNDGRTLSAWGRFKLDPIWRFDYAKADPNATNSLTTAGRNAIEDLATITVSGRWAVAAGGIAYRGSRLVDDALHAVDARTGSPRWSVKLADLDPALAQGSIRGPVQIDQGVVVVGVSKAVKERRLLSFHMAGLDLHTGELLWTEPLGSAGTLPYGAVAKIADIPTVSGGVIFQLDSLGFLAAVETVTGRVMWVRRLPLQSIIPTVRRTWEGSSLVVHKGALYAITPDRRSVLALDVDTGAELARRSTVEFRNPMYLLVAGDNLIAVGEERIAALTFDDFANPDASPRIIADTRALRLAGRAATAGDLILIPTTTGALVASASATDPSQATPTPLDKPGNLLALESELVVADAAELHTFLLWDVAQRVLTKRMDADPDDPAPAATFVEIAYRAGKPGRLLWAVDAALRAIERDPLDDHIAAVRARLFESIWSIVTASGRRGRSSVALDRTLEGELIDRLGRVAGSPAERVRHLLAQGAFYESGDETARAVDSYQQILDNPVLASTRFNADGVTGQAEIEATRGLTRVVRRFGPEVYRVYSAQARQALADLADSQDPIAFANLARRYPVSEVSARAWLDAADHFERQGLARRTLAALEDGLDAVDNALVDDPALYGELAGRLLSSLIDAGRLESAAATLKAVRLRRPTATLSSHGETLSTEQFAEQLRSLLSSSHRLPRVGPPPQTPKAQFLVGWRVERPLLERPTGGSAGAGASTESVVLRSDKALSLWRVADEGGVQKVWQTPIQPGVALIASTWDALILAEPTPAGRVFSRLDRATGHRLWQSPPLTDLMPVAPAANQPRSGVAKFLVMDRRTLAVVRVDGRAAAFDLQTGAQLWSSPSITPVVADAAADADTLLIAGDQTPPGPQIAGLESAPVVVAVDLRTGRVLKRLDLTIGPPRWARLTPEGLAIVGGDLGVIAYDFLRDRQVWRADDLAGVRTIDAWTLPERVMILDADAGLWQISAGQEHPKAVALDTRSKLARTVLLNQPIHWSARNGDVTLSTLDGVLVYNAPGELVGSDQRGDDMTVLSAALGMNHAVTVGASPAFIEAGVKWHDLFLFNIPSCTLAQRRLIELDASPDDITLLDGRILISAGKATLVLDAPAQ